MTTLAIIMLLSGWGMLLLGFLALVGANESVARATRYGDHWRARAEAAERRVAAPNVVSLRDAPRFDSIADILAANEARRADWDEPTRWDA